MTLLLFALVVIMCFLCALILQMGRVLNDQTHHLARMANSLGTITSDALKESVFRDVYRGRKYVGETPDRKLTCPDCVGERLTLYWYNNLDGGPNAPDYVEGYGCDKCDGRYEWTKSRGLRLYVPNAT
jgi:hypothetical protein